MSIAIRIRDIRSVTQEFKESEFKEDCLIAFAQKAKENAGADVFIEPQELGQYGANSRIQETDGVPVRIIKHYDAYSGEVKVRLDAQFAPEIK